MEVDWKQGKGCEWFGIPQSNVLSVKKKQVCTLSPLNSSMHPMVVKWREMLREIMTVHHMKYGLSLPWAGTCEGGASDFTPILDLSFMDVVDGGEEILLFISSETLSWTGQLEQLKLHLNCPIQLWILKHDPSK